MNNNEATAPRITYAAGDAGTYWAVVAGVAGAFKVRQNDSHRVTSSYFRWTAKGGSRVGHGSTRDEAVRNAAGVR